MLVYFRPIAMACLLLCNGIGFILIGVDKWKARHGKRRIPERAFFLLAVLGGSVGVFCGCFIWKHKTKHLKFMAGIPLLFLFQLIAVFWLLWKL